MSNDCPVYSKSGRTNTKFRLSTNCIVDLLTMHCNISRSVDADANFVAPDFYDRNSNVVTNDYRFVTLT